MILNQPGTKMNEVGVVTSTRTHAGHCAAAGLLVALLVIIPPLHAQVQHVRDAWRWTHFNIADGLPAAEVSGIFETPAGTVWMHTRGGVAWFDGFRWVAPRVDSLSAAMYGRGRMVADGEEMLFVAPPCIFRISKTGGHQLYPRLNGVPVFVRRAATLPDHRILLQSDSVLYVMRGDSLARFPSPFEDPLTYRLPDHPFGLRTTKSGSVWLNIPGGLYRLEGDHWQLFYSVPGEQIVVASITEDSLGVGAATVLVAAKQELLEWQGSGQKKFTAVGMDMLSTSIDVAPDGTMVLVQNSGGLQIRKNGSWHILSSPPQEMLNASVVLFRANGDLWIGKDRGLYLCRITSDLWTTLRSEVKPQANSINELRIMSDGTLWAATSRGILVFSGGKLQRHIDRINGKDLGVVTGLAQDRAGQIWISSGASFSGAYRWDGSVWKHFGVPEGLPAERIHRIMPDRRGRLWFLTMTSFAAGTEPELENGAFVLDSLHFTQVGIRQGLPSGRVYAMAEDSSGAFWFGSLGGLSRWDRGTWMHWNVKNGLSTNRVFTLAVDAENRVWFGHQFDGLGFIDTLGQPRYITTAEGIPSNAIWDLEVDAEGRLWVATREGIACYNKGVWASLGPDQGLASPYIWPLLASRKFLYCGTSGSGISVLNYGLLEKPAPMVAFADPVTRGDETVISWRTYAPWAEISSEEVQTRYRIDEGTWSIWGQLRTATVRDLSFGLHSIEVQSKGLLGQVPAQVSPLVFEMLPPFYFRLRFVVPIAVLLLLLGALTRIFLRRKREYARQLQSLDARYRAVVEQQTELIARLLPDGTLSFVNEAFCKLLGRSREELVGEHLVRLFPGDGQEPTLASLLEVDVQHATREMDFRWVGVNGQRRWLNWTAGAILDEHRHVSEIQVVGRDITDRKAAEDELQISEETYRIVAEQTGQLVYDYDIQTGRIQWYGAFVSVIGYTAAEFQCFTIREWEELIHPDDRERAVKELDRAIHDCSRYQVEYRFRHKDGTDVHVFDNGLFLKGDRGLAVRMLGTITNITERKRAEAQIAASLKEKEILIKEIHHRVKNNLQVISSLLNLQAGGVKDERILEPLRESQNRIRSMALIHERLYQSENLARIDFGEYLRSLVGFLARSYNIPHVEVNIHVENITLPINTAIPCGLIVNELASNALKYAFPGGSAGRIDVSLTLIGEASAVLTVADNGVGFPLEIDFRNTKTLGLQLINTLTMQINGAIGLIRDRGTAFSITFPLEL
jgi:PAS domain S-box-containing protein